MDNRLYSKLFPYNQFVCLFALEIRCTVCSCGTSTAYFVTYITIRGTIIFIEKHLF